MTSACILWPMSCTAAGYGQKWHNGKMVYAHRLAYARANGCTLDDIAGLVVRHKCDNPPCVNPDHLEIGTHADNMSDAVLRNRMSHSPTIYGTDHHFNKLSEDDVRYIRSVYVPRHRTYGARALGRRFGVDKANIVRIVKREVWKHVT